MTFAAIYGYVMPAIDQSSGELFGESFKPAVAGRYSPRPENGNARRVPPPLLLLPAHCF